MKDPVVISIVQNIPFSSFCGDELSCILQHFKGAWPVLTEKRIQLLYKSINFDLAANVTFQSTEREKSNSAWKRTDR